MTHAHPNCPKLKSPYAMVVQVCTVNGQTGPPVVRNALVEFLVVTNITTVAPNQLSKRELVVLTDGLTGHFGQDAVRPVPELDPDNKLISVALIQLLNPKSVVAAVFSLTGHHGVSAVKNVPVVSPPDHVSTNAASFQKNNLNHAVELVIMVSGVPGVSAMTPMVILSSAVVVFDDDLELDSVAISMKFKTSNVTLNDAVTIAHGLHGQVVQPPVVAVFKKEPSMIAMVSLSKSIEKSVPMSLLSPNGLNGVLAVLNVVMVSWSENAMTHVMDAKNK